MKLKYGILILVGISLTGFFVIGFDYGLPEEIIIHPCQKLALEILEADLEWRYYSEVFSNTNIQNKLVSEPLQREVILKEKLFDSGCYDKNTRYPIGDWLTIEFQEKMMIINYEGFHP